MDKDRISEILSKNKMILCKVPDHIYSLWKQMQDTQSEMNIGQAIIKANGELEMEFNEEWLNACRGERSEDLNKEFKIKLLSK